MKSVFFYHVMRGLFYLFMYILFMFVIIVYNYFINSALDDSESAEPVLGYLQQLISGNHVALGIGALTLAGVAANYYLKQTATKPVEPMVDLNNQSVIIDGKVKCLAYVDWFLCQIKYVSTL